MADNTITSADAELMLTATDVFPVGQKIQGFMADAAWATDAVDTGEFVQGVDGKLSAGFTYSLKRMTISIMPDSPSNDFFEAVNAYEQTLKAKVQLSGVLILPAIRRVKTLRKGYMSQYTPINAGARVLQGRPFIITWEQITTAPY